MGDIYHFVIAQCERCQEECEFGESACSGICNEEGYYEMIIHECVYCNTEFDAEVDDINEFESTICPELDRCAARENASRVIGRILSKFAFARRLQKYSQYLLEDYLHPDSLYIQHKMRNIYQRTSGIGFLNSKNQLILLKLE